MHAQRPHAAPLETRLAEILARNFLTNDAEPALQALRGAARKEK